MNIQRYLILFFMLFLLNFRVFGGQKSKENIKEFYDAFKPSLKLNELSKRTELLSKVDAGKKSSEDKSSVPTPQEKIKNILKEKVKKKEIITEILKLEEHKLILSKDIESMSQEAFFDTYKNLIDQIKKRFEQEGFSDQKDDKKLFELIKNIIKTIAENQKNNDKKSDTKESGSLSLREKLIAKLKSPLSEAPKEKNQTAETKSTDALQSKVQTVMLSDKEKRKMEEDIKNGIYASINRFINPIKDAVKKLDKKVQVLDAEVQKIKNSMSESEGDNEDEE